MSFPVCYTPSQVWMDMGVLFTKFTAYISLHLAYYRMAGAHYAACVLSISHSTQSSLRTVYDAHVHSKLIWGTVSWLCEHTTYIYINNRRTSHPCYRVFSEMALSRDLLFCTSLGYGLPSIHWRLLFVQTIQLLRKYKKTGRLLCTASRV